MGGKGSGRLNVTNKILKKAKEEKSTPASNDVMGGDFVLPNHSGIASHPEFKEYIADYIKKDGTTTTTANIPFAQGITVNGTITGNSLNLTSEVEQIVLDSTGIKTTIQDSATGSNKLITLPNITGELMSLAGTQTVTGAKTFGNDVIVGKIEDVGAGEDGDALYIRRMAVEGNGLISCYIDQFERAQISFTADVGKPFILQNLTGDLYLQPNAQKNVYLFNESGIGENKLLKQGGYITSASTEKYISWQVSDVADKFILDRQSADIVAFRVEFPFEVNSTAKFGDGGTTNYAEFKADGELNLHGTARVEKVEWIGANGIKAPGSKPATFVEDGLTGCWEFADAIEANQESISGTIKVPADMDRTVVPKFGIGWHANGVSPGNCKWQFEYLWVSPNEDVTAGAQETLTVVSTASATSDGLVVAEITGIDLPSGTDVAMFWKVTRLSGDVQDTISDVTNLRGNYFKYTSNKLGEAI